MKEPKRFLIVGGDIRQLYLAQVLNEKGFIANTYGFTNADNISKPRFEYKSLKEAIDDSDALILPLPMSRDGVTINCPFSEQKIYINELSSQINTDTIVFGGMIKKPFQDAVKEHGVKVYDYFKREELVVKNAVPTAEGVIKVIIDEMPITIAGSRIGVTGYGRTSKILSSLLLNLGSEVSVIARNYGQLAFAQAAGCKAVPFSDLDKVSRNFDIIVNTVPELVLDEYILKTLKKDCLIVEIASAPYGVNIEKAKELGLKVIVPGSLPGKVAPKTAGEIISDAILNIIKEEIT